MCYADLYIICRNTTNKSRERHFETFYYADTRVKTVHKQNHTI